MASNGISIVNGVQKVRKVEIGNEFSRRNIDKLKRKNKQLNKLNDENVQVFEAELSLSKLSGGEDELRTPASNKTLNSSQQHMFADHYREAAKKILHFDNDDVNDDEDEINNSTNKTKIHDVEINDDDIYTVFDSNGKEFDDFNAIWNISEPKYEDFALDDSGSGKMTPSRNSTGIIAEKQTTGNMDLISCNKLKNLSLSFNKIENWNNGNQICNISPTPRKRCSLNTEYSTDINRQLSRSFSNVTQRKLNVTSTLCNKRSKVIMDQLNAALSSKKSKSVVKLTLSQSTNTSPEENIKTIHLDQRSSIYKKKISFLKRIRLIFAHLLKQLKLNMFDFMFLLYIFLFALLFLALVKPNPICLNEEMSECFHEGESQINFIRFLQHFFNIQHQC